MRVLVTGGAGFVGRRFCKRLLDNGDDVTCVDNLVAGISPEKWAFKPKSWEGFHFVEQDCRGYFSRYPASNFDLVIHCAAIVGGRLKIDGDPLAIATDLAIDSMMFNWAVRGKTKPKVVYFSSSAVYPLEFQRRGNHCKLHETMINFDGDHMPKPDQTYGFAKLAGEYLAKFAVEQYGLDVVIYRPFGGYGEDQSFDYPFPSIIKRVLDGDNPVVVWGSGDQQRDFIHIEDVVDAVFTTMDQMQAGQALNLGTGRAVSFRHLARSALIGLPVSVVNDATKPEGVFSRVAETSRLFALWQPKTTLEQGIKMVAKFMLDKRAGKV